MIDGYATARERTPSVRSTRYQKQTRNAARAQVAQNAAQLELQGQQLNAMDHANVREEARDMRPIQLMAPLVADPAAPQAPSAGWYPDQQNSAINRWFSGQSWTEAWQPRQQDDKSLREGRSCRPPLAVRWEVREAGQGQAERVDRLTPVRVVPSVCS